MGIQKNRIIDLFTKMGGSELSMNNLFTDGYHPNTEGYKEMAKIIFLHIFKVSDLD